MRQRIGALLPEVCHVFVPGQPPGRSIGTVRRGQAGVRISRMPPMSERFAQEFVTWMNAVQGVSVIAERAMLSGAFFGWDDLRADPNHAAACRALGSLH